MFTTNQIVRGKVAGVFVILGFRIGADGVGRCLRLITKLPARLIAVAYRFQNQHSATITNTWGLAPSLTLLKENHGT